MYPVFIINPKTFSHVYFAALLLKIFSKNSPIAKSGSLEK
jgi:hypothetical protein